MKSTINNIQYKHMVYIQTVIKEFDLETFGLVLINVYMHFFF